MIKILFTLCLCVTCADSVSVQTEQVVERLPFLSLMGANIDINLQYGTTEIE